VACPLATAEVGRTEANLWLHEAVVEALMADRAVLPLRFGSVLADEAAVQSILETHYSDFVTGLRRVSGRAELGLLVLWDNGQRETEDQRPVANNNARCSSSESGRAYLLARLEQEHQAQAYRWQATVLADQLHAPLALLAAESTRQVLVTPHLLLRSTYLVERDRVVLFQLEVEALCAAYPKLRFLCTGPWPAYSFVTAVIGAGTPGPAAPEERTDAHL
jgi:hypothetical protein